MQQLSWKLEGVGYGIQLFVRYTNQKRIGGELMVPIMFDGMLKRDIIQLDPDQCRRVLFPEELEKLFQVCDAFWRHPRKKNPRAPHVVLTSGKHSNLYVNCPLVLQWSNLCQIMAMQMIYLLRGYYKGAVDWVIGSDSSALGLSKDMANILKAKWRPMQKGPNGTQVWEKGAIGADEWVLHAEGLLTTSGTTQAVRDGIRKGTPNPINFISFIPLLVHRPDKGVPATIDDSELIWLMHYADAYTVDPNEKECEYCKAGSPALSDKDHWDELQATM